MRVIIFLGCMQSTGVRGLISVLLVWGAGFRIGAQDTSANMYEARYQERIQQEFLYGVYIPKDLADVFTRLEGLTSREARAAYQNAPEREAVNKLHFSLGRWMIYNWGFYQGSRLTRYLNRYGISHPDDMARFLMICWHRYLNKRELEVKALVEELRQVRSLLNPNGGWTRDTIGK